MTRKKLSSEQYEALEKRLQERVLIPADYPLLLRILKQVLPAKENPENKDPDNGKPKLAKDKTVSQNGKRREKNKGHGRNSEKDYLGARDVKVPRGGHQPGDLCPYCNQGKLYLNQMKKFITLMATAPIEAIRFLIDQLRCSSCGQIVEETPEEARQGKFHPSANAAVALMKYGLGVPGKRLETWQKHLGVPLPDATQWDMINRLKDSLAPIFGILEERLAGSDLFHLDDTGMPVLSLIEENKHLSGKGRYGMHATGIIGHHDQHRICLYYVGRRHAGENLKQLLDKRPKHLPKPVQMGDASSRNMAHPHDTIEANCQSHSVRKFKDAHDTFPDEIGYILSLLGQVFTNDRKAKGMDAEQRLAFHQANSKPVMDKLSLYLTALMEEKVAEPRSALSEAISYMIKRWECFTRFLHIPGAPIDNNIVERALKLVIRLRKNSGFFKTARSAHIGAIIMSILATLTECGVNPMDYLVAVQMNESDVGHYPEKWLPWNYEDRLRQLSAA